MNTRKPPLLRIAAPLILLLALALQLGGCAYFNTYSNAKRFFREAEDMDLTAEGKITPNARKKYDESIEKCRKLLELYPDSKWVDDALFLMCRAYFEKSEYGRCLRRIDELEERFPEHKWREETLFMRGICSLEDGDEARAIAELQRLEDEYPESDELAEGIFRIGDAEYRLGNWQEAIDAYQRLLDRFEKSDWNDEALLKIADSRRELGDDSLAVATLGRLAEVGRDRGLVFRGQLTAAEILFELRDYAAAGGILAELEPTADNFKLRGDVLILLARVDEAEGRLEEAVTGFENVATEFPRSNYAAEAWYRIGLIRQNREEDLEEALTAFEQVRKELPRSLFADLAGNKRRAIQELLSYQAEFGESPPDSSAAELAFRLAENQYLRLENPQGALNEYRRVLEDYPDSELAPAAAYAMAFLQRNELAAEAAAESTATLLLARYPDSEAAAFVRSWVSAEDVEAFLANEPPRPAEPEPRAEPDTTLAPAPEPAENSEVISEPDTTLAPAPEPVENAEANSEPDTTLAPAPEPVEDSESTAEPIPGEESQP